MGRPIVTTDVPGCRNVVVERKNGFLVPPKESDGLCSALELLIADAQLRETMGRASRELAEEKFDERIVIDQIVAAYRELIPSTDVWPKPDTSHKKP